MNNISSHCHSRATTKKGTLRKKNNGCRLLNILRLVASPLPGISFGKADSHGLAKKGWIEIPGRILNRGRFTYVSKSGLCTTHKLEVGSMVVTKSCPWQGPDGTVPVMARTGARSSFAP